MAAKSAARRPPKKPHSLRPHAPVDAVALVIVVVLVVGVHAVVVLVVGAAVCVDMGRKEGGVIKVGRGGSSTSREREGEREGGQERSSEQRAAAFRRRRAPNACRPRRTVDYDVGDRHDAAGGERGDQRLELLARAVRAVQVVQLARQVALGRDAVARRWQPHVRDAAGDDLRDALQQLRVVARLAKLVAVPVEACFVFLDGGCCCSGVWVFACEEGACACVRHAHAQGGGAAVDAAGSSRSRAANVRQRHDQSPLSTLRGAGNALSTARKENTHRKRAHMPRPSGASATRSSSARCRQPSPCSMTESSKPADRGALLVEGSSAIAAPRRGVMRDSGAGARLWPPKGRAQRMLTSPAPCRCARRAITRPRAASIVFCFGLRMQPTAGVTRDPLGWLDRAYGDENGYFKLLVAAAGSVAATAARAALKNNTRTKRAVHQPPEKAAARGWQGVKMQRD